MFPPSLTRTFTTQSLKFHYCQLLYLVLITYLLFTSFSLLLVPFNFSNWKFDGGNLLTSFRSWYCKQWKICFQNVKLFLLVLVNNVMLRPLVILVICLCYYFVFTSAFFCSYCQTGKYAFRWREKLL